VVTREIRSGPSCGAKNFQRRPATGNASAIPSGEGIVIGRLLFRVALFVYRLVSNWPKWVIVGLLAAIVLAPFAGIVGAKIYQFWDQDPERGAIAIAGGEFGESYAVPEYLDQGWDKNDSLWFYNTTQGSAILPYDFMLALEQVDLDNKVECERGGKKGAWLLCDKIVDRFRYLPQKETSFNPDALPVGFTKETYRGKDYAGPTCAACHTNQVNFKGRALRIDGGPAMADMVKFMTELTQAMEKTRRKPDRDNPRLERFIARVLELDNDYDDPAEIEKDLEKWTNARILYNVINRSTFGNSRVKYGYARLDAFGRIYNRVLQHTINRDQVAKKLRSVMVKKDGVEQRMLSEAEIEKVLDNVGKPNDIILRDAEFWKIIANLRSKEPGFPGLKIKQMLRVRDEIFNPPNAPVSYPFLWDITRSDYVQWNALLSNDTLKPLGRNAGETIGVFAIIDWHEDRGWGAMFDKWSLATMISGQGNKKKVVNFQSSVDLFNLGRLESHLASLMSPRWPFCKSKSSGEYYLPTGLKEVPVDRCECSGEDEKIDHEMADRGQRIYAKRCQGCHVVIVRDAWDRLMVGQMLGIDNPQSTDKAMARNSVGYKGMSGNFKDTYQSVDFVGKVVVQEDAPVAQLLTTTVQGVLTTPDADKFWPRRMVEWIYTLVKSLVDNPMKLSVKAGDYKPDTTAQPYNSLQAYRARSLNGIWATAPYLHNGSVPSLYDLLLPAAPRSEKCAKARPKTFMVGAREFDPEKVGFVSEGYEGFKFDTGIRGNRNTGHEYGACALSPEQRLELIEYLKSL
jgi:hypothetical protein